MGIGIEKTHCQLHLSNKRGNGACVWGTLVRLKETQFQLTPGPVRLALANLRLKMDALLSGICQRKY